MLNHGLIPDTDAYTMANVRKLRTGRTLAAEWEETATAAKQCLICELRFDLSAELVDHLEHGHGVVIDLPADADRYGASRTK